MQFTYFSSLVHCRSFASPPGLFPCYTVQGGIARVGGGKGEATDAPSSPPTPPLPVRARWAEGISAWMRMSPWQPDWSVVAVDAGVVNGVCCVVDGVPLRQQRRWGFGESAVAAAAAGIAGRAVGQGDGEILVD